MRIVRLCERPEWIPGIASAHVEAFGTLLPDWTAAQAEQELRGHDRGGIPETWVAEDGNDWLGSVSLLQHDHEDIDRYAPWLASLYVRPQARGRGVARALIGHCVGQAARLGVDPLYLYCTDALLPYYARLGWELQERLLLGPLRVNVLRLDTGHRAVDAG